MSSARLFVYGSLKRGGLHYDLMRRARFLGEAETEPGFALEMLEPSGDDEHRYSALVERPGASSTVAGELFELTDPTLLSELDEFEGEAYTRRAVRVREMSGEIRLALAYMRNPR